MRLLRYFVAKQIRDSGHIHYHVLQKLFKLVRENPHYFRRFLFGHLGMLNPKINQYVIMRLKISVISNYILTAILFGASKTNFIILPVKEFLRQQQVPHGLLD